MLLIFKVLVKVRNVASSYAGFNCRKSANLSLIFHKAYKVETPKPTAPPSPHFLKPAVK